MATVRIPPVLRPAVGGEKELSAEGSSVGEILRSLAGTHPDTQSQLFAADGGLNRYVNVYLNDEDVRVLDGLDTAVGERHAGDPARDGGRGAFLTVAHRTRRPVPGKSGAAAGVYTSVSESERSPQGMEAERSSTRRRARATVMAIAGIAGLAVAGADRAGARRPAKTLKAAHNKTLKETIVVDSKGMTLYAPRARRRPTPAVQEQACFCFWPPYKVSKHAKLTKARA